MKKEKLDKNYEGFIDFEKFITPKGYFPKQCVELIVYDNDGPEGYYHRICFERSHQAISYINSKYSTKERKNLNFELTNHWKKK